MRLRCTKLRSEKMQYNVSKRSIDRRVLSLVIAFVLVGAFAIMIAGTSSAQVNIDDVTPTPSGSYITPGSYVNYNIVIQTNRTSGATDIYANLSAGANAWTNVLDGSSTWMGVNTSTLLMTTLNVTAPAGAEPGDSLTTTVTVESTNGTDMFIQVETMVQLRTPVIDVQGTGNGSGDPGDQVSFLYTIENRNNRTENFTLSYITPAGLSATGAPYLSIGALGSSGIWVFYDIDSDAETGVYHPTLYANISAGSDHAQFNVTVDPVYSYNLTVEDATLSTAPDEWAEYSLELVNNGNDVVDFDIETSSISPWTVSIVPLSGTLLPAGDVNISVKVKPPSNASAFSDKILWVYAVPEAGKGSNSSIILTTSVIQEFDVWVSGSSPSGSTLPGEWAQTDVTVNNDGNGEDTFVMNSTLPEGWEAQWVPSATLTVDGFSNDTVTIRVFIPLNESYGPKNIYVNATSTGNASVTSLQLPLSVSVAQRYDVSLVGVGAWSKDAHVETGSDTLLFNMTVTNLGNRRTDISLNKTDIDATGWSPVTLNPTSINLDPDEEGSVQLTVRVPLMEDADDYTWRVVATSGTATSSVNFIVSVQEVHDLQINSFALNTSISELDPDGDIYFDLEVENIGNVETRAEFAAYLPTDWSFWNANPSNIVLSRGSTGISQVQVVASDEADSDTTYNVTVETYPAATSIVTDSVTAFFDLNQTFDTRITFIGDDSIHAFPDTEVQFSIELHNEGTGEDEIQIEVMNPILGWTYEFSPSDSPTIAPYSSANLTLTVTSHASTSKGTYSVDLNATTGPGASVYDDTQSAVVIIDQVYDLSLTSPTLQQSSEPENTVEYYVKIENRGTGQDTFVMEKVNDTLPIQATIILRNTTHTLNSSDSAWSTLEIDIPEKEDIDVGSYWVRLKATSDNGTPFNTDDDISKTITFTLVIDPIYEIFVASSDTSKSAKPGNSVSYSMDITNIGSGSSLFWLNKTGAQREWGSNSPTSFFLNASDQQSAYLNVTLPDWNDIPPTVQNDGYVVLGLRVTCLNDPSVTDIILFNTTILPHYELEVQQINPRTVFPGEAAISNVTITNKGSTTDRFNTTFDSIPTNWYIDFVDVNDSSVELDADESTVIGIRANVPNDMDDAAEGSYYIDVEFGSDGADMVIETDIIPVIVDQYHDVSLFTASSTQSGEAGESFDFVVRVTNEGNANDTYLIDLQGDVENWGTARTMPDEGGQPMSSLMLEPEEQAFIYIWTEIPNDEDPGDYFLELNVSHDRRHEILNLTVEVEDTYDIEIDAFTTSIPADPGSLVTFNLRIRNTGTGTDSYTFDLDDEMAGWSFEGNSTDIYDRPVDDPNRTRLTTLGPMLTNEVMIVYLTVAVPEKIGGELVTPGIHYINVTGESENAFDKTDTVSLRVDVGYQYDFTISGHERREVDPGSNTTFTITIENDGNDDDTYGIQIVLNEGGDDWSFGMPSHVTVNESSFQNFDIDVSVPEDAEALEYTMILRVRSQSNTDLYEDFNFTVAVNTVYDIELQSPADTKTGRFDRNLTFQLNVENKGNGEDTVHLYVSSGKLAGYVYFTHGDTKNVDEIDIILENASVIKSVNVTVRVPNRDTINDLYGSDTIPSDRFTVKGNSYNDEDKVDNINLTVEFRAVYDFDIIETVDNIDVDANSVNDAELEFEIQNEGTRTDSYTILRLSSPQKMSVDIDYGGQQIEPGGSRTVDVTVTLPANDRDIVSGSYQIEIEVTSRFDDDVVQTFFLNFNIEEFSIEFELQPLDTNINWNPDPDEGTDDVEFNFRIKNIGTRDDRYTIDVVSNPFPGKVSFATTGYTGAMIPNRTGTVDVTTTMSRTGQPKDIEAGYHELIIDVLSNGNTTIVESITMGLTVEQFYDLDLNIDQNSKDVKVEEMTEFEINAINRGNGDDSFDISTAQVDPVNDWYMFVRGADMGSSLQNVHLGHDTEVTVKLQITPDSDEVLDEFDAADDNEIMFEFMLVSDDGTTFPFTGADERIYATIIDLYRFELDLPPQLKQTITDPKQGEDVEFEITVRNTGISEDKYSVNYNTNNSFIEISHSFDRSGMIEDSVRLTVTIEMDIDDTKHELWRIPAADYEIPVTIKSQEDQIQRETFTLTVGIDRKADLEEERLDSDSSVEMGGNTTYTFKITNYGNTVDTAKVRLTDNEFLRYGTLVWIDNQGVEKYGKSINVPIKRGQDELIDYIVRGDKDFIQENQIQEISERIEIVSSIDSNERITIDFNTEVEEQDYAVAVDFASTMVQVTPDEDDHNGTLPFEIENIGDNPDDIEIRIYETPDLEDSNKYPGDITWVRLRTGSIIAGASMVIEDMPVGDPQTVYIDFDVGTIPVDAEEGDYSYMVQIESKGGGPADLLSKAWQNITLSVEMTSKFDMNIDLTSAEIDPTGLDKSDEVEVPITIHNEGNFEDIFRVQTLGLSSDLDVSFSNRGDPATFQIDPDQEEIITMIVTADEDAREDVHTFQIRISSSEGGVSRTESFEVTVLAANIRISKHDIKFDRHPRSLDEGENVNVEVRVWNNGSGPITDLEVRFLEGGIVRESYTIQEIGASRFRDITFYWEDIPGGAQVIRIQTTGAQPIELNVAKDVTVYTDDDDDGGWGLPAMEFDANAAGILAGIIAGILIGLLILLIVAGRPADKEEEKPGTPPRAPMRPMGGPIPPSRTAQKIPIEPPTPADSRVPEDPERLPPWEDERDLPPPPPGWAGTADDGGPKPDEEPSPEEEPGPDDGPPEDMDAPAKPPLERQEPDVEGAPYPDDIGEIDDEPADWDSIMGMVDEVSTPIDSPEPAPAPRPPARAAPPGKVRMTRKPKKVVKRKKIKKKVVKRVNPPVEDDGLGDDQLL